MTGNATSGVRTRKPHAPPLVEYGTKCTKLIVDVDSPALEVGEALDFCLALNDCPGLYHHHSGSPLTIAWAHALPYIEAMVRKAIKAATTAAVRI